MLSTENPQKRRFFFIIVHYGLPEVTNEAIRAIKAGTVQPEQIVVIDQTEGHYQAPGGVALAVVPTTNSGYGAAANMGLGYLLSKSIDMSDIVVIMNNDVVVEPTTLSLIKEWWLAHPEPALTGVTTMEDGHELQGGGQVSRLTGRATLWAKNQPGRLDYIHGAFVMAPYGVFIQTKGWPEHYFLYWEDILLSTRLRRLHIPLRIASTVRVAHHNHKSETGSKQQLYYLVRNGAVFMQEEMPLGLRQWWRLLNYLRLTWHRWAQPDSVVTQALQAAVVNQRGPHTV